MNSSSALWKAAEAISKAKAYLIGNSMEKVLIAFLDFAKTLPDSQRNNPEFMLNVLSSGVVKEHKDGRIVIRLSRS